MARPAGRQPAEIVQGKVRGEIFVVTVNRKEQLDKRWNDDEHHPGSFTELGDRKDNHDNGCTQRTKTVDHHFGAPASFVTENGARFHNFFSLFKMTNFPPASGHADLGQSERKKYSNGVQRDKQVYSGSKDDNQ